MKEESKNAQMIRPIALAVLCTALISCGGSSGKKSSKHVITLPHGHPTVSRSAREDKSRLLQLMNQYRRANGRELLLIDDRLMKAAQSHSEAMNRRQQMAHQTKGEKNFQKRLMKEGYPQVYCSENIARAQGAELVHRLWVNSPGHKKNLLGKKYTRVGIGLAGQYWTANYAQAVGPPNGGVSMPPPVQSYTGGF